MKHPYIEILKPRMIFMVLVVAALGFHLGNLESFHVLNFLLMLTGCALASGGCFVLNQAVEHEKDAQMKRTQGRPIPSGQMTPFTAMIYGVVLSLGGVFLLYAFVNLLSAFFTLLTVFLYVLVYTPLKQITWLNTPIGAIPGALPPLVGWAASAGELSVGAWILFAILFIWQLPHFYAIAWMYREDYARAGFKMLPVIEPEGQRTIRQVLLSSALLIPVSLLPSALGLSGYVYLVGATIIGGWMLWVGLDFSQNKSFRHARKLLFASLIYLPVLLVLTVVDTQI